MPQELKLVCHKYMDELVKEVNKLLKRNEGWSALGSPIYIGNSLDGNNCYQTLVRELTRSRADEIIPEQRLPPDTLQRGNTNPDRKKARAAAAGYIMYQMGTFHHRLVWPHEDWHSNDAILQAYVRAYTLATERAERIPALIIDDWIAAGVIDVAYIGELVQDISKEIMETNY